MGKNNKSTFVKKYLYYSYPFFIIIIIMTISYKLYGYAPFGNNSLACYDADIQYLDFFAYLKDILMGKNSISYTFSKSLGGSNIAVFSYYLASPLNLLVLLFDKSNLHVFFNVLIAVKLGLSAVTMKIFLCNRFPKTNISKWHEILILFLSISYALGQYSLAQSSNIMWLDGVYLLPLILLGVYKCISKSDNFLLAVSVGLSIIFNWYTGGINCIFSGMWFILEVALIYVEKKERKIGVSFIIKKCFRYCAAMITGVCLSAVLFFPTIGALNSNAKGSLNFKKLFDISFIGHVGSAIQGYSLGSQSEYGIVALYCGSIVIIGCISIFLAKQVANKIKLLFIGVLSIVILCFYWNPLYTIFSLFKDVDSYWYRYSYIGIFTLIFVAAYFFNMYMKQNEEFLLIKAGGLFALLLFIIDYLHPAENVDYIQCSAFFTLAIACMLDENFRISRRKAVRILKNIGFFILVLAELFVEIKLEINNYHVSNVDEFERYSTEEQQQIKALKDFDKTVYRISQTSPRYNASYNEALAYNYSSIASYTSSPDDISREFLDKVGYRSEADCINVIKTSVIGADSFLGVKYVLSSYDIAGYKKMENIGQCRGKSVYKNPYALPLAFTYVNNETINIEKGQINNPFEYQNWLYSMLLGEDIELYIPIEYSNIDRSEDTINYTLKTMNGEYAYYGNLIYPSDSWLEALVNVNDNYEMKYSCWLSPSVFYIPTEMKNKNINITISVKDVSGFKDDEQQFYALDLKKLQEVTEKIKKCAAKTIILANGKAEIEVDSNVKESLCVTIPYSDGWSISVNGKIITPELLADSFYSIELDPGHNELVMRYKIKYLKEGILFSSFGVAILTVRFLLKRKRAAKKDRVDNGGRK